MIQYSRPLDDTKNVSLFMENILGESPNSSPESIKACIKIRDTEILLARYYPFQTLRFQDYRSPDYFGNKERKQLREDILKELLKNERPKNDSDIRLGVGGLLPKTAIKSERKFFLITGLPASGKSGISEKIADNTGALLIDNDYVKRKFPEFHATYGASIVHEESQLICEGPLTDEKLVEPSVLGLALNLGYNIVFPKICPTPEKVTAIAEFAIKSKYHVYLIHIQLDRAKATKRAYKRFLNSKTSDGINEERYVPLSLIFDSYADGPTLSYFETKNLPFWKGFARLSTDVPENSQPKLLDNKGLPLLKTWLAAKRRKQ